MYWHRHETGGGDTVYSTTNLKEGHKKNREDDES